MMDRITKTQRLIRISAIIILSALLGTWISSCGDDGIYLPTEYTVTIEVTGDPAAADVSYVDLETDPLVNIFSDPGAAVPYSRSDTETLDYSDIFSRRAVATASVADGETVTLTVYYEDVHAYPPDNNRRIVAQETYSEPIGGANPQTIELIADFLLPVQ